MTTLKSPVFKVNSTQPHIAHDIDGGMQSAMTGSKNNIVVIQDVATEDMNIVLKYMYGELDAIPEDRLHSLVLATKHMQV